jgi:L-threonylcarbamoyladenylate synthase
MKTRIMTLHRGGLEKAHLDDAVEILTAGGVAAYPTETFYGLGGSAESADAVENIFRLKGRDRSQALPLIASDVEMVKTWVSRPGPVFEAMVRKFWPGSLTLVLKASKAVPDHIRGPGGSVALRVPPLEWLRTLVRRLGVPLIATSANPSGQGGFSDPDSVRAHFGGRIDLIIDGGETRGRLPSTILDLTGKKPVVLREGAVSREDLAPFL